MDYNNNKTINFLENMIDISVDDINYINDVSVIVIDTSNHKIGINILNPQYEIDVCYGIIKTSKLLSNDICTNNIYVNNNDDLKISNNTINLVENTSSKLYIENTDINFLITNSLEIINFDLDHFNINIHNKYDVNNLYINSNIINNYSIQIYLDNTIDAPRPIDISNKPNETIIIYPNTYIENNNNHSYGKFIYRSLKSIKLSDKINNNITLNTANYANIPLRLDSPVDTTSVEFSYSNFHSEFFESHNSIVNGDYGGILIKLDNIYDYMNDTNTASFVYYTNSINSSKYWTTFGDNLNLYDGSLSCTSINITNNNNIFTIDFSNIKTNDELNIISDTLKIESSNCNINIYNNLNIDASNVLIESSNITLSGELINIKGETLINDISFIDNIINSNDLDILANSIANIICERLNINSKITTISGNTIIDGSLNIKENDGSINRYAHVPVGTIVMWYRDIFPPGWVLCDGTNNTPDLTNRFVKGANQSFDNLGDSNDNVEEIELTMDYFPDHSHNITYTMNTVNDNHHYHNYNSILSDISTQYTDIIHHHNLHGTNVDVENVDLSHSHPVIQSVNRTEAVNFQHHHNLEDHSHNIADTNIDHEHYIGSHTHDTEAHFHSVSDYQTTDTNDPDLNNNAILITNDTNNTEIAVNITTLSNNILEGGLLISEPPKNDTPMDMFNNRTGKIIDQNWISHHSDVIDTGGLDTINDTHHTHKMTMEPKSIETPINVDFSHYHEFNFPTNTETENINHSHNINGSTDDKTQSHNHIINDFSSTSHDSSHNHEIDISMGLWPGENYANTQKKLKIVPSYCCLYYIMKIKN
mgnify:CR=1 FL=1